MYKRTLLTVAALALAGCAQAGSGASAPAVTSTTTDPAPDPPALEIVRSLPVDVDGGVFDVNPAELRSWLADTPDPHFDPARTVAGLRALAGAHVTAPVDARFDVTAAGVVIVPAQPGRECCADEAAAALLQAVQSGSTAPVSIPMRMSPPAFGDDAARALGIVSPIATFTTNHPCCEARVENIHRIADLLKGTVIAPDGTFSINDTIGPRTRDKGFVNAPVITNHTHGVAVGGGISQFVTTLFNAAFFGGLDLVEYQSHSLYISRYPYGREATVSFPKPDLKLHNPTPYGVLVWPTYTDTSVTLTLYSTPWFKAVTEGKQTKASQGTCTVARTPRTRVRPDGAVSTETIVAVYHREGLPCESPPSGRQPSL